jgi:hypothetical protein
MALFLIVNIKVKKKIGIGENKPFHNKDQGDWCEGLIYSLHYNRTNGLLPDKSGLIKAKKALVSLTLWEKQKRNKGHGRINWNSPPPVTGTIRTEMTRPTWK